MKEQRLPDEHVVAAVAELPPGASKIVRIRNLEIGVYNVGGVYYAMHNMCPHQFGPLCTGPVSGAMQCGAETGWQFSFERDGEILTCPWHAIEFDLKTGRALYWSELKARTFPVRVLADEVCVQVSARRDVAGERTP